jgi:hypothetical protein
MRGDRWRLAAAALALFVVGGLAGAATGAAGTRPAPTGRPPGATSRFELLRVALDDDGLPAVGVLSGASIDPTWAVALGVEYDRYDEADTVPVFLHLRVTPRGGSIGHLVFVEAGYSLFWMDGTPGTDGSGPFARGGMGRRVGRLFGGDVHVSLTYRIQVSDAYAERMGLESSALTEFAAVVEVGLRGR